MQPKLEPSKALRYLVNSFNRDPILPVAAVFCDGGLICNPFVPREQRNPSDLGSTWAYVYVDVTYTNIVSERWGAFYTATAKPFIAHPVSKLLGIENNLAELIAAWMALRDLPNNWSGTFYTDSENTIGRIFGIQGKRYAMNNVPKKLQQQIEKELIRLGDITPELLDGHPTQEQLDSGFGKRGRPVSIFNHLNDSRCKMVSNAYLNKLLEDAEKETVTS